MSDLDLLHFEQLKAEVQSKYLKNHSPSQDDISKWKGIDIIYFQEDLRKIAKGNISEKSFYTYFKNNTQHKLPRIDMLNLLAIYCGYQSWYDFKKNHLFANEILKDNEKPEIVLVANEESAPEEPIISSTNTLQKEKQISAQENLVLEEKKQILEPNNSNLQISDTDNQKLKENSTNTEISSNTRKNSFLQTIKKYVWLILSAILSVLVLILAFGEDYFGATYTYKFTDADRNTPIKSLIEIKVFKENESPLYFRIDPEQPFNYHTKDKTLKMEVSSALYEKKEINRNLENAPREETIELKPDDYKIAVSYFSKTSISGDDPTKNQVDEEKIKNKRKQLDRLISDNAIIYQVYDSDIYGVETLDKEKYINLVTTPTTSLKNLNIIEINKDKNGKIISIKFKIVAENENS